jgi:hypothetical protein
MTGPDLEAAAADSLPSLMGRKPRPFEDKGKPCANCGAALEGPFCYACGQNCDTHHRSIWHLIIEAIEGMFHLDGRLMRTLPLLFFKPGVLARDLMEGRIARHAPPFRTFLVALLLFLFAAEHAIHRIQHDMEHAWEQRAEAMKTPGGRFAEATRLRTEASATLAEGIKEAAETREEDSKDADIGRAKAQAAYAEAEARAKARYARARARAQQIEHDPKAAARAAAESNITMGQAASGQILSLPVAPTKAKAPGAHEPQKGSKEWFKTQLAKAVANPEFYFMLLFGWAHRLAVLLLPIIGLSLALVYLNKRQYFIYDHLLVATNLLSFAFLTNALGFVLPTPVAAVWFVLLTFWTPINLFQTLRGGYGSSVIGAAFKTLIVWFVSVVAFATLLGALMYFTLSQI